MSSEVKCPNLGCNMTSKFCMEKKRHLDGGKCKGQPQKKHFGKYHISFMCALSWFLSRKEAKRYICNNDIILVMFYPLSPK